MSQSNQSEQFRILKQYIEQKDFDNFNRFLDNNEISKKTLNSILCFTLQNYRSNYEMTDYIQLLIEKAQNKIQCFIIKLQIKVQESMKKIMLVF